MFTSKAAPVRFLATLILSAVLLTGCARSTPETKPPETPQVGVINMEKAINAHPKYQEWQSLKKQAVTIKEQLTADANRINAQSQQAALNLSGTMPDGLKSAAEQEFKQKMAAKQQELQSRLAEKANKMHSELSTQLKAYSEELDKEYQPKLFNLQLKMQTVRMDEKEAAEVKKTMDALKAEQADKLALKEKELAKSLNDALGPDKSAMEQELAVYAKQLNAELDKKISAQTAELTAKLMQPAAVPPASSASAGSLGQQLSMKQQEINVLEEYIVNDIRDKTAKVAAGRGLEAVLTGYTVNVNAVDVTDAVIAAFKK